MPALLRRRTATTELGKLGGPSEDRTRGTATDPGARLRAAITIKGHIIDLSLASGVPIAHVISQLIPYLRQQMVNTGRGDAVEFLGTPDAEWHLERFGGDSLDPAKTLDEEGVLDGATLYLTPTSPGENYPALIDDVAESITYYQKKNFPSWSNDQAVKLSLLVLQLVTSGLMGLLGWWTMTAAPSLGTRVGVVCTLTAVAAAAVAIVITVARAESKLSAVLSSPLSVVAYLTFGTAALVAIPRDMSVNQLVVASSLVFVVAVFIYSSARVNPRLHYAVGAAALILALVTAFNLIYSSPPAVISVQVMIVAFLATLVVARLSLAVARIDLPYVPATGESYLKDDAANDISGPASTSEAAIESIVNQEQQVITAHNAIAGMLSGTLALIVAASFFAGLKLDNHEWVIWSFVVVVAACITYQGKSHDLAWLQTLCLSAAIGVLIAFSFGLLFSPPYAHNTVRLFYMFVIISLGVVLATVISVRRRRINSPIVMKLFEYFEKVLFASPLVYLVLVMDLYQKARAR
jgi:type VII secretion integral membrane protein EccD